MLRFNFILCHVIKVLKNSSRERKMEETTNIFKNNLKAQEEKLMKRHKKRFQGVSKIPDQYTSQRESVGRGC